MLSEWLIKNIMTDLDNKILEAYKTISVEFTLAEFMRLINENNNVYGAKTIKNKLTCLRNSGKISFINKVNTDLYIKCK